MNKLSYLLLLFLLNLACGRPDAVNTREEINESVEGVPLFLPDQADSSLYGVYRGILPNKNGDVLNKLSLYEDDSFLLLQKCENTPETTCEYRGKFKYDEDSKSIRFKADGTSYRFAIEEDLLHMIDKQGEKVQASATQTPFLTKSKLKLTNTIWQFERIKDSLLNEKIQGNSFLRFHPDGSLNYNINCNSCRASWQMKVKGEITIKGGICTKMGCDHPFEDQFNRSIREIRLYSIEGDQLYMGNKGGNVAVLKSPF